MLDVNEFHDFTNCLNFVDTKFEDCPLCKTHMPHFQEAAEYLEKLEDGEVSFIFLCMLAHIYIMVQIMIFLADASTCFLHSF